MTTSDRAALAAELHDLAGGWGVPAALQHTVDHLPGSLTAHVAYDWSIGIGLLFGDLAALVEAVGPAPAADSSPPGPDGATPSASVGAEHRAKDVDDPPVPVSSLVTAVLRPVVRPWMTAHPSDVRHAVVRLDALATQVEEALGRAGVTAAAVLTSMAEVADAVDGLAAQLGSDGVELRRVLRSGPLATRAVRSRTDALSAADATCAARIAAATAMLPAWEEFLAGSPLGEPVLPDGPGESVRETAAHLDLATVRAALARHPEVLLPLTDPDDETAPDWLAGACATDGSVEDALRRVDRVRRACAERTEDELARAALLFPRLLGGLDGVPIATRVVANRLVLQADLHRMREADVDLGRRIGDQREHDSRTLRTRLTGGLLDTWLAADAVTAFATVEVDRPEAARVEHRALVDLAQRLLHDRVDQGRGITGRCQVVQFAPDGRVVELLGHLDERTRQVAVYVGGTGTTVRQFGWPRGIGDAVRRADTDGATAVLVWMGSRFPSAIGTQSPSGRFARAAARPLRDTVEGLSIPDDVPITVVGHSYGGVVIGAAEALGLRADRIVHCGSPGIGPGIRSVTDYPTVDALGRARRPDRYALTAPGDLIRAWRRGSAAVHGLARLPVNPARRAADWFIDRALGADPMALPGIVELDTGIWETDKGDRRPGEILFGPRGHADCVEPGTTSFRRIVAIVQGRDPRAVEPPAGISPFRWMPGR